MTTYSPAYRLTLYGPRSLDPNEATILTPAGNAPHTDPFQVTTLPGVAGWRPYLDIKEPRGRKGRIDPLSKRTDVGELVFRLIDKQLDPTTNLKRWLTAFFGNALGRPQLMGLKVIANESLDGGQAWDSGGVPFWTGRLNALTEVTKNEFELSVRDMTEDLKVLAFNGYPHPNVQTYAGPLSLLPLGPSVMYGTKMPPQPLSGTCSLGGPYTMITFDGASAAARPDNIVTTELRAGIWPASYKTYSTDPPVRVLIPNFGGPLRAVVKHTSGALNGQTGTYRVGYLVANSRPNAVQYATALHIATLTDTLAPGYLALPANGVTVQFLKCYQDVSIAASNQMLFVNDRHPVQLISDLCAGYFGPLYKPGEKRPTGKNIGDPKRTIPFSDLNGLLTDPSFPPARLIVTKPTSVAEAIEKNICVPFQLGYYLRGGNTVVPVDLRRPTSVPSTTLTDADVVPSKGFSWSQDRLSAITRVDAKYYQDVPVAMEELAQRGGTVPSIKDAPFKSQDVLLEVLDVGTLDLGDVTQGLDAPSFRTMVGESINGQRRDDYIPSALEQMVRNLTQPYGFGAVACELTCRRTAVPTGANVGDVLQVSISWLPDPATNARGGARLMRLVEKTEQGLTYNTRWLDLGTPAPVGGPTVGTPTKQTGNTGHGISVAVTLNAGNPVELHAAVTATSVGTAPATNSPLWNLKAIVQASGTVNIDPFPQGQRIWVRGRSLPGAYDSVNQPSTWTTPASVDLDPIAAPSNLVVSTPGATSAAFTFSVGDATMWTEVRLSQPNGQPYVPVVTLPPTSNRYTLRGLDSGTTIGLQIAHTDGMGGYSASVSTTFTTSGSDPILPPPPRPWIHVKQ